MIKAIRYGCILPVMMLILLQLSCQMVVTEAPPVSDFVYTLNDLKGNDVFLVMVNTTDGGRYAATAPLNAVSGDAPTASVSGDDSRAPAGFVTVNGETLVRYERQFQIEPPALLPNKSLKAMRSAVSAFASAQEGDTKQLYADVSNKTDTPAQVSATLKKIGTSCKIWVADASFDNSSTTPSGNTASDNKINGQIKSEVREDARKRPR
jgi:hypothetical protein